MSEWVRVAAWAELAEGQIRRVQVGERAIALAKVDGQVRAFHALCPHASADLTAGDLRPEYVICALHAYRFDLRTGACLKPRDGPRLRLYRAEVRGDEVWVEVHSP